MGIDPAPFMANLFLHYYENKFILSLLEQGDSKKAELLRYTFRYLDDLFNVHDNNYFESIFKDIYPPELVLSKTNSSQWHTEFLDLDIK